MGRLMTINEALLILKKIQNKHKLTEEEKVQVLEAHKVLLAHIFKAL